ncbi:30S ribosomal protein S13 [archaeon]|jgi:small subunit ribosomal protein S13|nr:30S ribosomal protein S13 [archaeon]MBT4022717.1 30S ribosomal protein S13 [archaeon]MBT4273089.1 30S ribosomal protein S13 [archaeon]MBT4461070.1 30S ribosomal protein S13 [archaeon]MBT4858739.1 30S ribosomal protein S13 [archaeon]
MADEKIKHIIRVANTDLKGHKAVIIAMTKIKGIGIMFANVVCKKANVSITKKAGLLNENEVKNLTDVIENPSKYKIPIWMYNRRRDYDTGEDTHLITSDLHFTQQQDVRRLQKIKSNRGLRHAAGLPLRGQRTRSNFRRNKGKAVGVKRKKGKGGRV